MSGCYLAARNAEVTWNIRSSSTTATIWLCAGYSRVKEICLGRWVLRLAPFKFRVKHIRVCDNVVAELCPVSLRVRFVRARNLRVLVCWNLVR